MDTRGGSPHKAEHGHLSVEADAPTTPEEAAAETARDVREADPDPSPPPPPRAAVIYNPTKVDVEVLRAAVDTAAREAEWGETHWIETTAEDPGIEMAREAASRGVDMVLAAGGDGTVRAVAHGLMDTGVSMALLPLGTGNLLARNLKLRLDDVGDAVATAFAGEDRAIDVGMARLRRPDGSQEEHVFVVLAGLGLDAQMIENTDEDLKKRVGWLAYAKGIAAAVGGGNRINVRLSLDGDQPRRARLHSLLVGNCGLLPGNVVLLPEADISDGQLDIVMLRPSGPVAWVQIWTKIFIENGILGRSEVGRRLQGASKGIRALRYKTAARVSVGLREPEPIELDGDSFGEVTAFDLEVRHQELRVRVPSGR